MNNPQRVAANLPANERKGLAFLSLTKIAQVTQLADQQGVSRQFVYRQKPKAEQAIDQAFADSLAGVTQKQHFLNHADS